MNKWGYILMGMALACAIAIACIGCGLRWVPSDTPSPGSGYTLSDVALDTLEKADAAGWGDLIQILGGAVGCGGIVAVGRKALKNRQKRKALEATNSRQDVALREIIAGVREIIDEAKDKDVIKDILNDYQKSANTRKLVADMKINANDENRDPKPIN